MIQNIIKYFLGIVFLFSAISKLIDYSATVELFEGLLAINMIIAKLILSILILVELIFTYFIVGGYIEKMFVFQSILWMLLVFLFINILFAIKGYNNCGCFGSEIISSPLISFVKNMFLLVGLIYLKYPLQYLKLSGKELINK